jgi:hypothetical protein
VTLKKHLPGNTETQQALARPASDPRVRVQARGGLGSGVTVGSSGESDVKAMARTNRAGETFDEEVRTARSERIPWVARQQAASSLQGSSAGVSFAGAG